MNQPGTGPPDGDEPSAQADVLTCPAPRLTADDCAAILREHWGYEPAQLSDLPSERDLNAMVDRRYVLKVSNPAESAGLVDLENPGAQARRSGRPRPAAAAHGADADRAANGNSRRRRRPRMPRPRHHGAARADGRRRADHPAPRRVDRGARRAHEHRPARALPPAAARVIDWDVRRADAVLADVDPALFDASADELSELRARSAAAAAASLALPSGLNHADLTLTNILVDDDTVTGLIDLGDMHHTANVCDLAVTATSVIRNTAPCRLSTPGSCFELSSPGISGTGFSPPQRSTSSATSSWPGSRCPGRSPRAESPSTRTTPPTSRSTTTPTTGSCESCEQSDPTS